jgi:membrane fusion protein (multidrug efflux system)
MAGDVLFRIDDRDYRARFAQASANLEAAVARLASVEAEARLQSALIMQAEAQQLSTTAQVDLAMKASDRRRVLIDAGAVSQAQLEESDAARAIAEASASAASASLEAQRRRIAVLATQRDAATASIAQAKAARDLAQIDLENTVVRAPVNGVIGNRQVRIGRLVAPGASLIDIVPVDDVWIVANFKETQVEHIRAGQSARILIDGYPNASFEGVVDSFAPGSGSAFSLLPADNATGNFVRVVQRIPVKIRFAKRPEGIRLVPGLSARVEVRQGEVR